MKTQALPSKEEKNGFTTYFPGHDVYAWTISPARFRIGGADGCFEYQKAEGTFWKLEHLPYVYAVMEHQGALYIASDEGLYIFEDHREVSRPIQSSIRDQRLRMLYEDANDILWAGGFGGVTSEKGEHYDASNGLLCDMVNVMLSTTDPSGDKKRADSDQSQELWFGSYSIRGGGISIVDQEEGEQVGVKTEKNIVHPNVNVILKLDDRHVLTGGGFYDAGGGNLFSRRGGQWILTDELTKKDDALPGEKIRSAALDQQGRLWIGSEYNGLGLYRFQIVEDKIQLTPLTYLRKTDGLADDEIKKMAEDDHYYYFGTRNGLSVIRKTDFDHLFPGM